MTTTDLMIWANGLCSIEDATSLNVEANGIGSATIHVDHQIAEILFHPEKGFWSGIYAGKVLGSVELLDNGVLRATRYPLPEFLHNLLLVV